MIPRALDLPPGSEVIVPSFTFAATAQALLWNGLVPVFCECLPGTLLVRSGRCRKESVATNVSDLRCGCVWFAPPISMPCWKSADGPASRSISIVRKDWERPIVDNRWERGEPVKCSHSARARSSRRLKAVFFTTNDAALAGRIRAMRDYGKDPVKGEEMLYLGLSARMSELHAAVGLLSLLVSVHRVPVKARMDRIAMYRDRLGSLPGCWVQEYPADRTTSGNYFVLFITDQAKVGRDDVYESLKQAGIQTKRYFYPPLHEQAIFKKFPMRLSNRLSQTQQASSCRLGLALVLPYAAGRDRHDSASVLKPYSRERWNQYVDVRTTTLSVEGRARYRLFCSLEGRDGCRKIAVFGS